MVGQPADGKSSYYYANGVRVDLVEDPTVYAVKFLPGHFSTSTSVAPETHDVITKQSQHVNFIPNYGLQIYSSANPQAVAVVAKDKVVEYASPGYKPSGAPAQQEHMFATNQILVQFKPEVTPQQALAFNDKQQLRIVESLAYAPRGFRLQLQPGDTRTAVEVANAYFESGLVIWAEPDFVKPVHTRAMVAAEVRAVARAAVPEQGIYLSQQWHLENAQVKAAWELVGGAFAQGRPSIKVAILDDGVDIDHPEYAMTLSDALGKVKAQKDFGTNSQDAKPKSPQDNHGTACAGVAIAGGVKAYGAAPTCSLIAARTPDYLGVADEALMFQWAADNGADVISCSWGIADGVGAEMALPGPTAAAIDYCVAPNKGGRKGKGIPIFWAAGNGNEPLEKPNGQARDGYAACPQVMAVAASTSKDAKAYYSDFGQSIWVCAPSSGNENVGERWIFTVDRQGAVGYNNGNVAAGDAAGNYTNRFGGTSAAAPLVAGIAALVLSANPDLTESEVRNILKTTADNFSSDHPIGLATDYDASGHSKVFGFGRVNALKAVQAALGQAPAPVKTGPAVTGPATLVRTAPPPQFTIQPGGNAYWAFEITSQPELLDIAVHGNDRTADNFFGDWYDERGQHYTGSVYTLPQGAWDRLKVSPRLYYRIGTTPSSTGWDGYQVSTPDDQGQSAPSIVVTGGATPAGPTVKGPASVSRSAATPPPTFQVITGTNPYYIFEITSQADLFDDTAHDAERNDSNFYGSWSDGSSITAPTYTLPQNVWDRLKLADRLYYRIGTSAARDDYVNYTVSTPDNQADQAPFLQVTAARPGGRDVAVTVSFPSGATFDAVDSPEDGRDYSDPAAGAVVPLIDLDGRLDEYLCRNFKVSEFASRDGARYARISPDLVAGLQALRDAIGAPLVINSAYRPPDLNQQVDGALKSRHMAGQAADVASDGTSPLDLARAALGAMGCTIGIGLGANTAGQMVQSIHVDVRGSLATWTYAGAELNDADFKTWVQDVCASGGGGG